MTVQVSWEPAYLRIDGPFEGYYVQISGEPTCYTVSAPNEDGVGTPPTLSTPGTPLPMPHHVQASAAFSDRDSRGVTTSAFAFDHSPADKVQLGVTVTKLDGTILFRQDLRYLPAYIDAFAQRQEYGSGPG